jgi:hypothetical protein
MSKQFCSFKASAQAPMTNGTTSSSRASPESWHLPLRSATRVCRTKPTQADYYRGPASTSVHWNEA